MSKIPKRFSENGEVLGSLVENGGVLQDPQIITVGNSVYDSFSDINDAVNSITDSSVFKPYKIVVKSGQYTMSGGVATLPAYVSLEGSGRQATRINMSGWNYLKMTTQNEISNITLSGDGISGDGMITFGGIAATGTSLNNVDMFLHGGSKSAIHMKNENHTVCFTNVNIVTDSIGITMRGFIYMNSCNIFMSGDATGTDYIGIDVPDYLRLYLWGTKIGTGYGRTAEQGYGGNLEVVNDPTSSIIGINIPTTNQLTCRLQLHGLESFCRNDSATTFTTNGIHCIKASGKAWVRMFGGFVQSEVPLFPEAEDALTTYDTGTIELYGTRYSTSSGNIVSRGQDATSNLTVADDGTILENWDGGTKFCDATAGAINLSIIPFWMSTPKGIKFTFIKTDSSVNPVVITSNDFKISTGGTTITLVNQYDKVTLVSAGGTAGLFEV